MPIRRISNFIALPLIVMLESMAWYGMRGVMSGYLVELGYGFGSGGLDTAHIYTVTHWVTLGGTLLGGLLAVAAGPLPVIIAGLLMAGLGIAAMGAATDQLIYAPLILASLGVGLFRPALYGAALIGMGYPREHLRGTLCVLLWASMNVAALLAMPLTELARNAFGYTTTFAMQGMLALLAAVIAAGLGAVHLVYRNKGPAEPDTTRGFDGRILAVLGGVLVLCAIPWGSYNFAYELFYTGLFVQQDIWGYDQMDWIFNLNPVIVLLTALLLGALLLGLHFTRVQLSSLVFIGLGLMGVGLALGLLSVEPVRQSMPGLLLALGLLSVAEVLAGPLLISRLGGDVHWRLATLVVALWLLVTGFIGQLLGLLRGYGPNEDFTMIVGFMLAAIALLFGLIIAIAAIPLQRKLLVPVAEEVPQTNAHMFEEGVMKERI